MYVFVLFWGRNKIGNKYYFCMLSLLKFLEHVYISLRSFVLWIVQICTISQFCNCYSVRAGDWFIYWFIWAKVYKSVTEFVIYSRPNTDYRLTCKCSLIYTKLAIMLSYENQNCVCRLKIKIDLYEFLGNYFLVKVNFNITFFDIFSGCHLGKLL